MVSEDLAVGWLAAISVGIILCTLGVSGLNVGETTAWLSSPLLQAIKIAPTTSTAACKWFRSSLGINLVKGKVSVEGTSLSTKFSGEELNWLW